MAGDAIELGGGFRAAFEQYVVSDLDALGVEVRRSAPTYSGLGTLPQTDPVACRNRPVIGLADGTLVPLSLELVADRAAVLWRFLLPSKLKGTRSGIAALGFQFEAYITDLLANHLGSHHRVLTEADIASVLGGATRCDQIVINGNDWVFIENSMITLNRQVAAGTLAVIDDVCDRYHTEADQASETARHADRLALTFGLPRPTTKTILVVTDNPATHTPALMQRLWDRRPDRNPRFVCGIREFEALVDLGRVGWSLPGAIGRWQRQPVEGPLQSVIYEMAKIRSSSPNPLTTAEEWVARLSRERSPAA